MSFTEEAAAAKHLETHCQPRPGKATKERKGRQDCYQDVMCWTWSRYHACNRPILYCPLRSQRQTLEWNKSSKGYAVGILLSIMHACMPAFMHTCLMRTYPPAFGKRLVRLWVDSDVEPMRCLRTEYMCVHA